MKTIIATLDKIDIENVINSPLSITSGVIPPKSSHVEPLTQFYDKKNKRKPPSSPSASSPAVETTSSPIDPSVGAPVCVMCFQKYGNPYICLCQKDQEKTPAGALERSEAR